MNHLAASFALVLSGTALDRGVGALGRVERTQGSLEAMLVALRRALLFETELVQGEGPAMEAGVEGLSAAFALPCLNSLPCWHEREHWPTLAREQSSTAGVKGPLIRSGVRPAGLLRIAAGRNERVYAIRNALRRVA